MEEAVGQIVSPSDPPEVKLQKIYARVQQIRNTSFEVQKTEEEVKREKEKTASNAEDLWKRGYGDGGIKLSSTSNNSWMSKISIFMHVTRKCSTWTMIRRSLRFSARPTRRM